MKAYDSAKKIIEKLHSEGHVAYFAGGWVRDYLMGHPSSDIDIATDAPPEKILKLFKRTIPVGISFGVVIVVMDNHQFEVSTFRKDVEHVDGRRPEKIVLTNEKEDAIRRDFTINGMFYDPFDGRIIDYVDGQEDLKKGIVRAIGDPNERFKEDRLRMIRAIRFAFRFNYQIDALTREAIKLHAKTLFPAVSMERIWQELKKMAEFPLCDAAIVEMSNVGLLQEIFPKLADVSLEEIQRRVSSFQFFPKESPAILYFMELFPKEKIKDLIALCQYLKVSNKDQKLVEFVGSVRHCSKNQTDDAGWAKIYAHPSSDLAISVVAARLNDLGPFIKEHEEKKDRLKEHVERIKAGTPLMTSSILQSAGILPGKAMGQLLHEAEILAINRNMHSSEEILKLLKQSENWPK